MQKLMKNTLKYILAIIIIFVTYISSLLITSLIPQKAIEENVAKSAQVLKSQGNNLFIKIPYRQKHLKFDNYTDALMINTIYSVDTKHPLESSMLCRKNYIPGVTKIVYKDSVSELKSASKYKELDQVGELNDTVNKDIEESFEYARYWHGHMVPLRIMLCLFDITLIRIILIILLVILMGILLYLIYKNIGGYEALIFLLGFIAVEYFYIGISLQGCWIFFIAVIASIIIIKRYDKIKDIFLMFLIIGSLANFFDFLTVPIVTLGIPFIIYFLLKQKKEKLDFKDTILLIIKIGLSWGIGYFVTYILKWIVVDLIYNRHLFNISIMQFKYRSTGIQDIGFSKVLELNFRYCKKIIFLELIITVIYLIKNANKYKEDLDITKILPYITMVAIPIIWYFLLKQHSLQHSFFTYRNTILVLVALPFVFTNLIKRRE